MRKKKAFLLVFAIAMLFVANLFAGTVKITYETADLGSNRWQYTYDVTNISLTENIEEFTIWFDHGLYDNLAIETLPPLSSSWDQIVIQPEPAISDNGFYDALSLNLGVAPGETLNGFIVSFEWLGSDTPGSQFYEIINPATFDTIDSGFTVPEPLSVTILLLGFISLHLRKKK